MGEWWEQPYRGHPMEGPPLPRPLYPPDANRYGKKPSIDGPDIVALKRTVSRLGRWPWQQFDDSFSNFFSHGSGSVADSGIAGFQRQQHIDDTGWIGTATYNALRSALVPEGLPHAGEPGMDATAIKLLEQAWDLFGGSEPAAPGLGTVRKAALDKAITQLGVTESPPESNLNPYGAWYGVNGQPWCAIFCTWAYVLGAEEIGRTAPSFLRGSRYAYVPYVVGDARANRYGLQTTDDPIPGDLVCYDWSGDGTYDHIGLFSKWTSGTSGFQAIEGNTSYSSNSNGGEVMRRDRTRGAQGTVFVRVAEP